MSYDIIKRIGVKDGKVIAVHAANNVRPHHYSETESSSLTKIFQEQGQAALDLEILKEYESGNFQGGSNKYTRALKVLRNMPEYMAFNWRNRGLGAEYDAINKRRKTLEFDALLKQALAGKLPRTRYVVSKDYFGAPVFMRRLGRRSASWTHHKELAKKFVFAQEAERVKRLFTGSESWLVEQVANQEPLTTQSC